MKDYEEITLSNGMKSKIDVKDYIYLAGYKWSYWKDRNHGGYAVKTIELPTKFITLRLAHAILDLHSVIIDNQVDHINGDKLDNRFNNLRIVTNKRNAWNRKYHDNNTSGFRGVYWYPLRNKWVAQIRVHQKLIHLGYWKSKIAGALAYKLAKRKYHAEI